MLDYGQICELFSNSTQRRVILLREYDTQQRKFLLAFLMEHADQHFTVEELADNISGISISTVYRNVNNLVGEGIIKRFQKKAQRKFLYQYIGGDTCSEHLHLKCNTCGRILHMDNESALLVLKAVKRSYDFEVDKASTVIFGACVSCK